ncbi:MAG TPA: hypothetical protein DD412_00320 [Holosporales bacterium]|nr:hypothetical protein [Holosporales bacterium]
MFLSKKGLKLNFALMLVSSFFIQASYGSKSGDEGLYLIPPPTSLISSTDPYESSSEDSEPEEDRHLRIQKEMREKLVERNPKTIILDVLLPSNAEEGSEYIFNKNVTLRDGKEKTITFTFTKKKVSGNVHTFTGPFHCWCVSPRPSFKPADYFFDIDGKIIQQEKKKPKDTFSGLGDGQALKEESEMDIAFERMKKYMDILREQTKPPALELFLKVSGTSFQVEDRSE